MIALVITTLSYGDAMGNDTLMLKRILQDEGIEAEIYAHNIGPKMSSEALSIIDLPDLKKNDILIYQFGTCDHQILKKIMNLNCKKILYYQNITPAEFFLRYSLSSWEMCTLAREELLEMKNMFDYCWTASDYSKQELIDIGYKCPMDVLPILVDYTDYNQHLGEAVLNKYANDDWINIVFVGRIAPNKKQEDIIKIFAYYKQYINKKARLILVGNYKGMEKYYHQLQEYVNVLEVEDVIFTGHISFNDILAYYNLADIFLCMTEHEGFCVPLIEAMYFDIPIIAYESTAVTETLGGSGVSINTKDEVQIAQIIDYIINNKEIKQKIIKSQQERLEYFSFENTKRKFLELLDVVKRISHE